MGRLQGKVAFVTGGGGGLGRGMVELFAAEGASVLTLEIRPDWAQQTERELRANGAKVVALAGDVTSAADVRNAVRRCVSEWGRLDLLVNNAGIYHQADATATPEEVWNKILAVNLTGAFLCIKHAAPAMKKGGAIVNVASEAGLVGIRNQVAYNVSKGGLIALTRSCAVDFASRGIRVNCVCPGTTETPLVQAAVARAKDPAAARRSLEEVRPANRLGTPEEIASAILYLSSDAAAYATGAVLSIDGGFTAQ